MNKADVQALRQLIDQYDEKLTEVVKLSGPDSNVYVGPDRETSLEVAQEKGTAFISELSAAGAQELQSLTNQMKEVLGSPNPYA